jgi:hypothetical protein
MVILWLKEVFRDSKSPPLSQKSWPNCLNTLEIDLSHEWQTVTSTIFILKYFQHVWSFGKMVILWLKVLEILKVHRFLRRADKLFKYLMEIDLSHEWQTVTSTIFHFKILSACL